MGSKENGEERENETERETNSKQIKENGDDSDYEPARDSLSSQEDSLTKTPNKKPSKTPNKKTNNNTSTFLRPTKSSANRINNAKSQIKPSQNDIHKKNQKLNRNTGTKNHENKKNDTKIPSRPSSEISEETDEKTIEIDGNITNSDDELEDNKDADITIITNNENKKTIIQMETKIEKLEQELREVAALEISIYSIVPEHMCSVNKVHTPARRLSRLYIRACTNWETNKKASVGKNIVNGVVLVAKSCGNDVSRLTYWLSNMVVLREIISQTFGNISQSSPKIQTVTNSNSNGFKGKNLGIFLPIDDWRETCTFIFALEKIESWIFSRIVESVWWQALTPHMQSPNGDPNSNNNTDKHLGPVLGDPKQGNFSIELWKSAFQDAFMKLCPLRSSGHECGCLPILAKMVMEECVGRLDIAMFNAILRESASEIPTDPVSDPIVDTKVLPIPAGHLSFGSGAQLKNSIGNWSRWLSDNFGMDSDDSPKQEYSDTESSKKSKTFCLLNELSDLLMLPKDLLLEKSIRKEVCPSIALSLAIRILCNFTPDEFCPDPVPGIVLEELNSESMAERLSDKILSNIFPYTASKVTYTPPSPADVAQKASPSPADVAQNASDTSNTKSREFERKASMVQRRGYTSDDDLDDLDSPLKAFIERTPPVTPMSDNGGVGNNGKEEGVNGNLRYKLLREVWCD